MNELPRELKQGLTRHIAPPGLKRRVGFMIEQQSRAAAPASVREQILNWWRLGRMRFAGFVCGALVAAFAVQLHTSLGIGDPLQQQLVENHVRSLMVGHLTDVPSSNQHTVKPWFVGKLDYAPPVIDLEREGFPLVGGRLDSLQGRAIASLVYKRNAHTINVFIRPRTIAGRDPVFSSRNGYNIASWTAMDMEFQAISDLNADELKIFVRSVLARDVAQNGKAG